MASLGSESEIDKNTDLSKVRDLEIFFKKFLGFHLLLLEGETFSFKISLQGIKEKNVQFTIKCIISDRTEHSINFMYYFKIGNERYDFLEFYYHFYKMCEEAKKKEYMTSKFMNNIFSEIIKDKHVNKKIEELRAIEKEISKRGAYDSFTSKIISGINPLIQEIQFSSYQKLGLDLSRQNIFLVTNIVWNYFNVDSMVNEADFSLDATIREATVFEEGNESQKYDDPINNIELFEVFYKQILTVNLINPDHRYNFNMGGFISSTNIAFGSQLLINNSRHYWAMGMYFPFLFFDNSKQFKNLRVVFLNEPVREVYKPNTIGDLLYYHWKASGKIWNTFFERVSKTRALQHNISNFISQYEHHNFYPQALEKLGTLPKLYFNGQALGFIALALPKNKVQLKASIFMTQSESFDETIFNYFPTKSFDVNNANEKNKLLKIITELKKVFDEIFGFYPYHPMFFNQVNPYLMLYTSIVKKMENLMTVEEASAYYYIHESQVHSKNKLFGGFWYNYDPKVYYDFNALLDDEMKQDRDFFDALLDKISEAYLEESYLWIPAYIEKYIQIINWKYSLVPHNERKNKDYIKLHLTGFINDIEQILSSDKIDCEIRFEVNKAHIENNYFLYTTGKYLIYLYYNDSRKLVFFKLNCVSFTPFELNLIEEVLSSNNIEEATQFPINNGFFRGLSINNIEPKESIKFTNQVSNVLLKKDPFNTLMGKEDMNKIIDENLDKERERIVN